MTERQGREENDFEVDLKQNQRIFEKKSLENDSIWRVDQN